MPSLTTSVTRITTAGFNYDLAGNLTADVTSSYAWNAESEIKTANSVNYTYDGDGNRVQKSNGKIYWYGAGTEILDESDASGNFTDEYVFFGGKRVAHRSVSSGNIFYYAEDLLGSSRAMVEAEGTVACYDADFYPYGGEKVFTNTCPQNYKFEGKERDAETGNDDFGARYYSSVYGRWLSPDWSSVPAPVPYANLNNPQSLNLYAMVADNPETFADLDGHDCTDEPGVQCESKPASDQQAKTPPPQNSGNATDKTAQNQSQQPSASQIGAAVGAVGGAVVGAVVGAVSGAAVGTAAEPGGGTVVVGIIGAGQGAQTGAETGAAIGAAAGALAPVVYTKTKEAAQAVGKLLNTAIDHLGKLNGPDQNPTPRRGWRDTVRKSADNISKQADKIANKNLANAARFAADLLRGLVD